MHHNLIWMAVGVVVVRPGSGFLAATPFVLLLVCMQRLLPTWFFTPEERVDVLLLSEDGSVPVEGTDCKKLKDPTKKRFRGVWLRLPRP